MALVKKILRQGCMYNTCPLLKITNNVILVLCNQWRLGSACASMQSDQSLLFTWRNHGSLAIQRVPSRNWTDCMDAESDISFAGHTCPEVPFLTAGLGGSVSCTSDWWSGGCELSPCWVRQYSFIEIYHEIFSRVILSLPLILECICQFLPKDGANILVNCLED